MALCNITGTLYLPSGELARSARVIFSRADKSVRAEYLGAVIPDDTITQTNSAGEIDVSLLTGRYVLFTGRYSGGAVVPDADTATISDILTIVTPTIPVPAWLTEALAARDAAVLAAQEAADAVDGVVEGIQPLVDEAEAAAFLASAEATRAETAANNAAINANVYPDVATGRAAVADGVQFQVLVGNEYVRYRRDSATTQTEVARFPSAAGLASVLGEVSELKEVFPETMPIGTVRTDVPVITDDAGRVALSVDLATGDVVVPGLRSSRISIEEATDIVPHDHELSEVVFAIVDSEDRVVFSVLGDGTIPGVGTGQGADLNLAPVAGERIVYEVNHVLANGQSLSISGAGLQDFAIDPADLTFSGGVTLRANELNNTFVPLFADNSSTVLWYALRQAKAMMRGGPFEQPPDPLFNSDYRLLASSHGTGGTAISGLVKGGATGSYEDAIHGVQEAARISSTAGDSYGVQALLWIQGESDRDSTTAIYRAAFEAMLADYRADIAGITAQPNDFAVLTYQQSGQQYTAPAGSRFPNKIAQAFFEASEADGRIVIATPTYWLPHSDELHLTGAGYRMFGAMMGKVLYRRVYRQEAWRPVEPLRISKLSDRVVIATFNVPVGPLAFDTTTVSNPGDYGFDLEDDNGPITLSEVSISGNTVKIAAATSIGANPRLSYAHYGVGGAGGGPLTGARGCLRDSDPAQSLEGDPLYNWGTAFIKPIPYVKG